MPPTLKLNHVNANICETPDFLRSCKYQSTGFDGFAKAFLSEAEGGDL